jgi:hypothetical protein
MNTDERRLERKLQDKAAILQLGTAEIKQQANVDSRGAKIVQYLGGVY